MRVLSLSSRRTLSLLRRVVAPFSVLATRGHSFYFQEVFHFDATISYGYDVTLLQNWVLQDDEFADYAAASRERTFVYDLADPALLQLPRVQEQLRLARLVTVPNSYLEKEVRALNGKVRVLPSCIDFELFMSGRNRKSDGTPFIGCFGPHDWYLVKEAVQTVKEKHPRVRFLGDNQAAKALGTDLVDVVPVEPGTYPGYINICLFGLCPYDGDRGQETIWGREYGILCKPIIAARGSQYSEEEGDLLVSSPHQTGRWLEAIETMLRDDTARARSAQQAFQVANQYRATKQAGTYLSCYEKNLPHLG